MIYPPVNSLLNKADSRYTLVVVTAKRARQLTEGAKRLVDISSDKPVTIAIHEINDDKISYKRTKTSVK